MFTMWRLRRARAKVERKYARQVEELQKKNAPETDITLVRVKELLEARIYTQQIALELTFRLQAEAERFDVEVPPIAVQDEEGNFGMWQLVQDSEKVGVDEGRIFLSSKGRAHLRRLIEDEKGRRFEVKTRWVTRVILPIIGALVGIIGAITGLVAVMRHKP
jgi:hypothetical protein